MKHSCFFFNYFKKIQEENLDCSFSSQSDYFTRHLVWVLSFHIYEEFYIVSIPVTKILNVLQLKKK